MKKSIKLRIIFMGTPEFARKILQSLIDEKYNIVAVYTQPDAPRGRKREIMQSPVKELAVSKKIPVYQPVRFNSQAIEEIKKIKPDIIIVAAYGKILPQEVLEIPGFGCINIHASLLPKYRGPSPIQNALINGDKETGVSIFLMEKGIDTGPIIACQKILIKPDDNAVTLSQKLSGLASQLLIQTLPLWVERKIKPIEQDHNQAIYCQLIEREDGRIIWEDEALNIYNKYRALYDWPGIFCYHKLSNGSFERLKLIEIDFQKNDPQMKHDIGEVFQAGDKIAVQTGQGIIIIKKIQPEGKKPMDIKDYINGNPQFLGSILT